MTRARPAGGGRAALALTLAALLVAGACGSTLPERRDAATSSSRHEASELGAPPEVGPTDVSAIDGSGAPAAPLPGVAASPSGQPPASAAPAGPAPATGPIRAGAGVRGVTDDTIYVGMPNIDLAAVNDVVGSSGGEENDAAGTTQSIGDAVAAHINQNGGIAGRKLKIVWHTISNVAELVTPEGRRRDAQRACATWTEDNSVFAFMGQPLVDPVIYECARENNAVFVPYPGGLAVDEKYFDTMRGLWYGVTRMIADRRDRNLVDNLVRRGVLKRDAKVGIMVEDWEGSRRGATNGMTPALTAHGIEVVATAAYPDVVASPWENYVLQFRNAGVTHILFNQTWDVFPVVLMMRAASNQGWHPIWGLGSDNYPVEVALNEQSHLPNTYVMGWQPWDDVRGFDDTEARNRCSRIAQKPIGSDDTASTWRTQCDVLFFLKSALDRAPEISPAGMDAAMSALGDSYQSMANIGGRTSFGSGRRHDGVAVQRDVAYDPRCNDGANCFRYVGEPRSMP